MVLMETRKWIAGGPRHLNAYCVPRSLVLMLAVLCVPGWGHSGSDATRRDCKVVLALNVPCRLTLTERRLEFGVRIALGALNSFCVHCNLKNR